MEKLLTLFEPEHLDIWKKMYPEGPTPKQVPHATWQIENTLKGAQSRYFDKCLANRLLSDSLERAKAKEKELSRQVESLRESLKESEADVRRLSTPATKMTAEIEYKLEKLSALECAGVDNWEGYDYAMESMNEEEE